MTEHKIEGDNHSISYGARELMAQFLDEAMGAVHRLRGGSVASNPDDEAVLVASANTSCAMIYSAFTISRAIHDLADAVTQVADNTGATSTSMSLDEGLKGLSVEIHHGARAIAESLAAKR